MDLLDELDDGPIKCRTFKKLINIPIELETDLTQQIIKDNEEESIQDKSFTTLNLKKSSILGFGLYDNSESSTQLIEPPKLPIFSNLLGKGSFIFDKVKRRLNNESQEEKINDKDRNEDEIQHTQSILNTQKISEKNSFREETQLIEMVSHDYVNSQINDNTQLISTNITQDAQVTSTFNQPTLADSTKTQMIIEEEEEQQQQQQQQPVGQIQALNQPFDYLPETQQRTGSNRSSNLFVDESDDEWLEAEKTQADKDIDKLFDSDHEEISEKTQKIERKMKVEELAAKKKAERLLKKQQSKSKEDKDLENRKEVQFDENDIKGKKDTSDDEDTDEEQNHFTHFDLGAHTTKKFGKHTLFASFGVSTTGEFELTKSSPIKQKKTPNTSPHELSPRKANIDLSNSDNDSDLDVLDVLKRKPSIIKKDKTKVPVLKEPKNVTSVIELDDSDSDVDVGVSKAALFDLRTRISKQKSLCSKPKKANPTMMSKKQLFQDLKNASKRQIRQEFGNQVENPVEKELLEKANLNVQDLLQKHIEHNNRVKEKEEAERKRRETGEADYEQYFEDENDSDYQVVPVADSEFSEDNDNEEEYEETRIKRKQRRMVVKDDEEKNDNEVNDDEPMILEEPHVTYDHSNDKNINLSTFGDNLTQNFVTNESQDLKGMFNGISMTQVFEKDTQKTFITSNDIFDQLRKNDNRVIGEESFTEKSFNQSNIEEKPFTSSVGSEKLLADDEQETQLVDLEAPESITQDGTPSSSTQSMEVKKRFKRLTRKRQYQDDDSEQESEMEEETEEEKQERLRQIELVKQKRREFEAKQKKQKKEMKAKGLDKMMENEAEESEDEWFGVGGVDGEQSDVEDSEDEKMVDDFTRVKINRTELEKKLRDENIQADNKMIERILTDLENGRLGKRGKGDTDLGLDIDEGEDEIIRTLRLHQQIKMREQFEKDEALKNLAKDKKTKAFFESITEDSQDSKKDVFGIEEESSSDEENDNLFQETIKKQEFKDPSTIKKRKITERFVQKALSFISNGDDEDDDPQLGFGNSKRYSNDFEEAYNNDLSTLRQNSIIQMSNKTPVKKSSTVKLTEEESPSNLFKMPPLSARRSFLITSVNSTTSGEVTYSKQYKASSGNKASVMAFGKKTIEAKKQRLKEQRVLKARKTTKVIQEANRLKTLNNTGFD